MLLYISQVHWMEARHLHAASVLPSAGLVIARQYLPWAKLPTVGLSSLSTTEEIEHGLRSTTAKLTCTLESPIRIPSRPVCFRLVCVDGTEWVLGTDSRPHPAVTQETAFANRPSERSVCTLTAMVTNGCRLLEYLRE